MIDNRIKAIENFVQAGSFVADIGADHGYLAIELIKSGRARKVIATEKNLGPFEALSKNISGFNIEARLGDGLQVLTAGEIDTICIAGMGGALITKILVHTTIPFGFVSIAASRRTRQLSRRKFPTSI